MNTITWKADELFLHVLHFPKQEKLYNKYFPNTGTTFNEQRRNLALLLNNNHFTTSTIRPGMPNTVDIGGFHVEPAKPLPKAIKEFLDSAEHGAILFSMGSMIKATDWPTHKREALVKAFGKIKQKVLWKYENETLPNKSENVMISPWIPQRDVLAHPNLRVFFSHGGLLGTSEALVEGVPILAIPVYGDQKTNMNVAVANGYAMVVPYEGLNEESISQALDKILKSSEIALKAKEYSRLFNDRPISPQKALIYFVEYAIKYKGAKHLRPASLEMSFIEINLIDVYAALLIAFLAVLTLTLKFLKFTIGKCFGSNKSTKLKYN